MITSALKSLARIPLTILGFWLIVWVSNWGLFVTQLKSYIIDFLFSWLGGVVMDLIHFVDELITCGLVLCCIAVPLVLLLNGLRRLLQKETILDIILCAVMLVAFFLVCDWRVFDFLPSGIQEFVVFARDTLHFNLWCPVVDEELHVSMFTISLLVGSGVYIYCLKKGKLWF